MCKAELKKRVRARRPTNQTLLHQLCQYQWAKIHPMLRPDHREPFYSLFWLGRGVTRVGNLVCFISMLAWYGSQSEAAV